MNKSEMLETLENAKKSHLEQMKKIEALVSGREVENPTAIGKMECDFGKIFYGNKECIFHVLGAQFFEKIDTLHERWHFEYVKIYNIFFKERKEGLFAKLTGADKVSSLERDKAKLYYTELKETTNELLHFLDASLRRAAALSNSKFKN
jgi:hypothetical protein